MSNPDTRSPRFPAWETLPDFGLYMDQLLTFAERCYPGEVTAGMINSYVKAGIVERPQGKKYTRQALAQLLIVCGLKPATPLDALRQLLHPASGEDTEALYAAFREGWDETSASLPLRGGTDALRCAICAACFQARCRELLGEAAQAAEAEGG